MSSGLLAEARNFGAVPLTLDVDRNGVADALSDGILIVRYLFGFTDSALTNGVVGPAGSRTNPSDIVAYLDRARSTMLDPDGNGKAEALTDGIVIVRYLFGFTDDALITDVVDHAGTRNTAAAIETFLNGFLPVSSPSVQEQSIVADVPVASSATTTTTTASDSTAQVVPLVVMEPATAAATTATVTDSNYGQAYAQQSWVKNYVNGSVVTDDEELDDELVIQLQEPVVA